MIKRVQYSSLGSYFFRSTGFETIPSVERIIREVCENGDTAVRKYTKMYDGVEIQNFKIDIRTAQKHILAMNPEKWKAVDQSISNVRQFTIKQKQQFACFEVELQPGVFTGQVINPVEKVGVYIPGGNYPLISSVIMSVVPAKVAGVKNISLCSPPGKDGAIHPDILALAGILNIDSVYSIGGAQAIAALAYGTETVEPVDLIVGPGNRYVTYAKKMVYGVVGIDFLAGPSEILIISDETGEADIIAADMIAQAEHDADASSMLLTTSADLADMVSAELEKQLKALPEPDIARASIDANGIIIVVDKIEQAIDFANCMAPEHLELIVGCSEKYKSMLTDFGSLFIGSNAAEIFGDYNSGLNHILPTNSAARYTGGLSVAKFLKFQTTLRMDEKGIQSLGRSAVIMAESENLNGHMRAVEIRNKKQTRQRN
jgi:histidinol dehydrogenase